MSIDKNNKRKRSDKSEDLASKDSPCVKNLTDTAAQTPKNISERRQSHASISNAEKEHNKNSTLIGNVSKRISDSTFTSLKTLETYIEPLGIDVPSEKRLLAYNRVGKVSLIHRIFINLL